MHITFEDFIAGWIGGVCGLILGHPLDTAKVRQQNFNTDLYTALRRTYKYEGLRGFYKGLLFPMLTLGPTNAVFFGVYGNVMKMLQHSDKQQHTISPKDFRAISNTFIAGTVAGFAQVLLTIPVELIKTTQQARTGRKGHWKKKYEVPFTSSLQALNGILKTRGVAGLYRGAVPSMLRDVPTSGIYVLTYEMLLHFRFSDCESPVLVKQMAAGGSAGIASWLLVIPVDVIKSRMQADNPDNPTYRGTWNCFYKTYKAHGLRFFFKGTPAILLRTFPVNAATFVGYEAVLGTMGS